MRYPLDDIHVTSVYGMRTLNGTRRFHAGVDFRAKTGTPVFNVTKGVVHKTGFDTGGGYFVIVDHGYFRTKFLHLSKIKVVTGDVVDTSTVLALSGNTGKSTAPHLHFEVSVRDGLHFYVNDPMVFFKDKINQHNTSKDWFRMASKEELKQVVQEVLGSTDIAGAILNRDLGGNSKNEDIVWYILKDIQNSVHALYKLVEELKQGK